MSEDNTVIYVLEDGETYSGEPSVEVWLTPEELQRVLAGEKVYNVVPDWETRGK